MTFYSAIEKRSCPFEWETLAKSVFYNITGNVVIDKYISRESVDNDENNGINDKIRNSDRKIYHEEIDCLLFECYVKKDIDSET